MLVRITDTILYTSFYILLFAVPFLFNSANSELFEFNKMLATYALAVIITGVWAIKCILSGQIIFRRTVLDIPLLLFLVSQIASTYFSIDPHTSIWGYYSRSHGGLLSTVTYLALYWAFVSNMGPEQVKTAIKYLLSGALIISIWGILEHFGASPSCYLLKEKFNVECWVQDVQTRVFATLGQPNWLAAWLVAIVPLTWAIAITNYQLPITKWIRQVHHPESIEGQFQNSKFKIWVWVGISAILFSALLFTKSRSGLLGFTAAFIFFWAVIAWIHKDNFKALLYPFLLLITSYLLLVIIFGTPWTPGISTQLTASSIQQNAQTGTQLETGGTESGEIRKIVWKGTIDIWRAYPIFGSGVETFAYSYYQFRPVEHNMTSEWDFLYNKAHNEYLNFAATTGTVGLGAYLLLIGIFLFWAISKLKSFAHTTYYMLHTAFLAGFTSILVTNFFGFSVVNVATLFFLFPAMAFVLEQTTNNKGKTKG